MTTRQEATQRLRNRVSLLREYERLGLLIAAGIGLVATLFHWTGLVLGGLLLGVVSKSTPRALIVGASFGLVVWGLFLATLLADGVLLAFAGMGRLTLLNVAITLGFPTVAAAGMRALS